MTDRDITVTVQFDVSNDEAHMSRPFKRDYASELLREVARKLEALCPTHPGDASGRLTDGNGNTIGEWSLDGDLD